MNTLKIIFLTILLGICTISCRQTPEESKQDIVEDVNDAMAPVDEKIKEIAPKSREVSEDEMIQNEINRLQDSLSKESIDN